MNAVIKERILGITPEGIPAINLTLSYKSSNTSSEFTDVKVGPIYLVDPTIETLESSAAAQLICIVLNCIGVHTWEEVLGKPVQIDINSEGQIEVIKNILNDSIFMRLIASKNEEIKTEQGEEAVIANDI